MFRDFTTGREILPTFACQSESTRPTCSVEDMLLPTAFVASTRQLLGDEAFERLSAALCQEPPVSIRVNDGRRPAGLQLPSERVPWATTGYYLEGRPAFTFDPLLHAGCYYVQEASSMFLEQVLRQHLAEQEPVRMLDLCAAPGGKSTHARSLLPSGSLLVANEVIRQRTQVLAENLTKWGQGDVVVTQSDPAAFGKLEGMFDVVLADVPCSGEGMFRKDEGAVAAWSAEGVRLCAGRQRRIVADVWPALHPGGLLIYSTCTMNVEENEENVRWIAATLGAEPLPVRIESGWGIMGSLPAPSPAGGGPEACRSLPAYRFLPHLTRGEGLFMAVLRKTGQRSGLSPDRRPAVRARGAYASVKGRRAADPARRPPVPMADWLQDADRYVLLTEGERAFAFPRAYLPDLQVMHTALHVVQAGIVLAEVRGRDWLPAHALALSTALRPEAFPRVELDYRQALAYLRREAIALPDGVPRGLVLVTYRSVPLGFAKNLGSRANNLYPQEWRIRSGYGPEEEVSVLG